MTNMVHKNYPFNITPVQYLSQGTHIVSGKLTCDGTGFHKIFPCKQSYTVVTASCCQHGTLTTGKKQASNQKMVQCGDLKVSLGKNHHLTFIT